MITEVQLAWLAGIWDGEGSILLTKRDVKNERVQITPNVYVGNTDIAIMNEVSKLLELMGCNFHWQEKNLKSGKVFFVLQSTNLSTIKRFLEQVNPYLIGTKRHYGERTLKYVSSRIDKADKKGIQLKHLPYDDEDLSFVCSSTTTREKATA